MFKMSFTKEDIYRAIMFSVYDLCVLGSVQPNQKLEKVNPTKKKNKMKILRKIRKRKIEDDAKQNNINTKPVKHSIFQFRLEKVTYCI